jgi:hypothetical protein
VVSRVVSYNQYGLGLISIPINSYSSMAGFSGSPTSTRVVSCTLTPLVTRSLNWLYSWNPDAYFYPYLDVALNKLLEFNNIAISLKLILI